MGYADKLRGLLRPLGLYELDSGFGSEELEALGGALDAMALELASAEAESALTTATGAGLSSWEALLPFTPSYLSTEGRRASVAALLRIDGGSFTQAALSDTLTGCGIRADVAETGVMRTVTVSFPGVRGIPADMTELRRRIERILPCHLDIIYIYDYVLWSELQAAFASWAALEAAGMDWEELEKFEAA